MNVLYVISDQEGAGKTALCATLAHKLMRMGRRVAVFKPLARAGSRAKDDPDAAAYAKLLPDLGLSGDRTRDGWPLDLPKSGLTRKLLKGMEATLGRLSDDRDVALGEGSCALSPEAWGQVAEALDAKALVVARYRHDLTASDLAPWRDGLGQRLLGFVINGLTRYQRTNARAKLLPSMEAEGLASFGVIPEDRRLLGVSVAQLAQHLEGRFLVCEEKADALVEHLMVGGLSMDPGDLYFGLRRDKAAIIRGDRPDLQMATLSTPTACMVLTGGIEPIEYVRYEAEQEEVPIVVVEANTLDTMKALDTLIEQARFDHPLKLSRFSELVDEHLDLPALLRGLGLEG